MKEYIDWNQKNEETRRKFTLMNNWIITKRSPRRTGFPSITSSNQEKFRISLREHRKSEVLKICTLSLINLIIVLIARFCIISRSRKTYSKCRKIDFETVSISKFSLYETSPWHFGHQKTTEKSWLWKRKPSRYRF